MTDEPLHIVSLGRKVLRTSQISMSGNQCPSVELPIEAEDPDVLWGTTTRSKGRDEDVCHLM